MIKLKARFWEKILLFMMMIRYILLKSLLKTSKPISSVEISKSSTILATPLEPDVFENILKEPIIKLSQTPPPPLPISSLVSIETTIPPLLKSVSKPKSLSQNTLPFQILIFTDSIMNPISRASSITDTPPEASTFEFDTEGNWTPNVLENTSNVDSVVNIGVNALEPPSTSIPHVSPC